MASAKRRVEVFTAGCPICVETVCLVKQALGKPVTDRNGVKRA